MKSSKVVLAALALTLGATPAIAGEPPSPPPVVEHYVVEQGDTFSSIAAEFGVTVGSLALANPVQWARPEHVIYPGDVLHVVVEQGGVTSPSTTTSPPPSSTTTSSSLSPTTSTSVVPSTTSTTAISSTTTTSSVPATSTTSPLPSSTTTVPQTTTTTLPPSNPTTFVDGFANLNQWAFAHWRNEIPGHGAAPSSATVVNGAARIIAADQNYGDATLRSLVPYDLRNGGTVAFTASLLAGNFPLVGFPYVAFTDRPYNAPSIDDLNGHGPTPQNGVYVQFRDNCRIPWGPPQIVRYTNWAETYVEPSDQCLASPPAGAANRVELRYQNGVLTIVVDGQTIRSAPVTIPPVGWLILGVHNHSSDKYANGQPSVDVTYDDVTYPATTSGRAFVVFNAYGRNTAAAQVTINGRSYPFTPHVTTSGSFAESVEIDPTDSGGTPVVTGFNVIANVSVVRPTGGAPSTPTTSPSTSAPTTPTSTSAPTTPSSAPTPSTTTTSTVAPTTSTPSTFTANFSASSDLDRFEFQIHTSSNGAPCSQNPNPSGGCVPLAPAWLSEHDMACGSVATLRDITGGQTTGDNAVTEGLVYHCPNTTGHMMTTVDTGAVAILSFSPNQTFNNVRRICWDQNVNNLGEGKWVNVHVIPEAQFQANGRVFHYVNGQGFGLDPSEIPAPSGALTITTLRGSFQAWQGNGQGGIMLMWEGGPADMDPSPAPRYRHCVEDVAGPTLRFTVARPTGITQTFDRSGTMPQGQVRVIWQDGSYNPQKHAGTGHLTWHWDQITVE